MGIIGYITNKDGCDTVINLPAVARACPERVAGLPLKWKAGPATRLYIKGGCDTVMNLAAVARACPERIVGLPQKRKPGPTICLLIMTKGSLKTV